MIVAVSPAQVTLETAEACRRQHARDHQDQQACARLWCSVLYVTMADSLRLRCIRQEPAHMQSRHDTSWLRQVAEYDPTEFVSSTWFNEVCGYVGIQPQAVRRNLARRLAEQEGEGI